MEKTDILIIGAGLLGCFAARELRRYHVSVTVLEKREDVCTGLSRANTGIIYAGYDNQPGSLKSRLCVQGSRGFASLCAELDVPFSRCGSLMIAFGGRGEGVLRKKLEQGRANGVEGLRLLTKAETLEAEPHLSEKVTAALYCSGVGTVEPWALGIGAYENAKRNGADFRFNVKAERIGRSNGGFAVETDKGVFFARAVLNCAGLAAAELRETCMEPSVRIFPTAADYFVLDDTLNGYLNHVIFHEPEEKSKGLTLVPTVGGNILVGPTERDVHGAFSAADTGGIGELTELCHAVVPGLPTEKMIRTFAGVRPNPDRVERREGQWVKAGTKISDFCLLEEEGLFSLVGIKTPGLSCAGEIGRTMAERITAYLGGAEANTAFCPTRHGIERVRELDMEKRAALIRENSAFGRIVCRCKGVTEGEVRRAIERGAVTVDGVKRRTGAGMGRCQGGFCTQRILELISESTGLPPEAVSKDGAGSTLLTGGEA